MDGLLGGTAMGSVRGENNHSRVFGGWGICFKKRLPYLKLQRSSYSTANPVFIYSSLKSLIQLRNAGDAGRT